MLYQEMHYQVHVVGVVVGLVFGCAPNQPKMRALLSGLRYMSEEEQFVECCTHGTQQATYVCQHIVQSLRDNKPRGFWSAEAEPGAIRPGSWCSACEDKVNSAGGVWNDESEEFAGVVLLCGACYDRAKMMNSKN